MQVASRHNNQPAAEAIAIPDDMLASLRSDHAGESGAVSIYRGILAISRDAGVREFALRHKAAEERHLDIMERLLPREQRSRLLILWRVAGWLTGALPALFGAPAVYRTIDAVESFVDDHYRVQIDALRQRPQERALTEILQACRDDELEHRDEARTHLQSPGITGHIWIAMVSAGSRAGVYIASRI